MFARRRDVLEREAERIGALAVAATSHAADWSGSSSGRSRRSAASTSSSNTGGPPAGQRSALDRRRARGRPFELLLAARRPARRLCLPHLRRARRAGSICIGRSRSRSRSTASRSRTPSGRRDRLGEDARARGRPDGITVNTSPPGASTRRACGVYGDAAAARASSRRSRSAASAARGDRRRRLLPRLGPRAYVTGTTCWSTAARAVASLSAADPPAVLAARRSPGSSLSRSRSCSVVPSDQYLLLPDSRAPRRGAVTCRRSQVRRKGGVYSSTSRSAGAQLEVDFSAACTRAPTSFPARGRPPGVSDVAAHQFDLEDMGARSRSPPPSRSSSRVKVVSADGALDPPPSRASRPRPSSAPATCSSRSTGSPCGRRRGARGDAHRAGRTVVEIDLRPERPRVMKTVARANPETAVVGVLLEPAPTSTFLQGHDRPGNVGGPPPASRSPST